MTAWKLFLLLPFMLLRRPLGRGRIGKSELTRRFDSFGAGRGDELLWEAEAESSHSGTARVPREILAAQVVQKMGQQEPFCVGVWGGFVGDLDSLGQARVLVASKLGGIARWQATHQNKTRVIQDGKRPPEQDARDPGEWPHGWQYWASSILDSQFRRILRICEGAQQTCEAPGLNFAGCFGLPTRPGLVWVFILFRGRSDLTCGQILPTWTQNRPLPHFVG